MSQYTKAKIHPSGFISVDITEGFERKAKLIREERDKIYGNIFPESNTDMRWVGDLGELVFNSWLRHLIKTDFEWIVDDAAGKPDFIIKGNLSVGVKTVKRKVDPKEHYTAQVSNKHINEPSDYFFFMSYNFVKRSMWLLGGINKIDFINNSNMFYEGCNVHAGYKIRKGHKIRNIEISKLQAPDAWIHSLTGEPS